MAADPFEIRNRLSQSSSLRALASLSTRLIPDVYYLLRRATRGYATVLDMGTGSESSPFRYVARRGSQTRTGIDHFAPSIERSRRAGVHDEYILADIFASTVAERSYECVTSIDVIEHFEKQRSTQLLERLESIATKRVIIFTPNGFLPQEPFDGNESQRHLCGWTPAELRARGYRVYGAHGLKLLRGEFARPRAKPVLVGMALAMASQYLALWFPSMAFHLFAVKDIAAGEDRVPTESTTKS